MPQKEIGTTGTGTLEIIVLKSKNRLSMKYSISKTTSPKMPTLGKGTESIQILLKQVSKDMYEPLVPMFFPVFGAHMSGAEFQYPDLTWKEPCGLMANLVAESGDARNNLLENLCL